MDHHRPILLLLLISLLSVLDVAVSSSPDLEEPLIQQVVPGTANDLSYLSAEHHFTSFMRRFGKSYKDEDERQYRLSVFKSNMRRAQLHQKLDPTAVHGVTEFFDLTPKEFRKYMGLKKVSRSKARRSLGSAPEAPILPTDNLPDDFDWRDYGAVTGVKNQVRLFILLS
jgi:cathepsin F